MVVEAYNQKYTSQKSPPPPHPPTSQNSSWESNKSFTQMLTGNWKLDLISNLIEFIYFSSLAFGIILSTNDSFILPAKNLKDFKISFSLVFSFYYIKC